MTIYRFKCNFIRIKKGIKGYDSCISLLNVVQRVQNESLKSKGRLDIGGLLYGCAAYASNGEGSRLYSLSVIEHSCEKHLVGEIPFYDFHLENPNLQKLDKDCSSISVEAFTYGKLKLYTITPDTDHYSYIRINGNLARRMSNYILKISKHFRGY